MLKDPSGFSDIAFTGYAAECEEHAEKIRLAIEELAVSGDFDRALYVAGLRESDLTEHERQYILDKAWTANSFF